MSGTLIIHLQVDACIIKQDKKAQTWSIPIEHKLRSSNTGFKTFIKLCNIILLDLNGPPQYYIIILIHGFILSL